MDTFLKMFFSPDQKSKLFTVPVNCLSTQMKWSLELALLLIIFIYFSAEDDWDLSLFSIKLHLYAQREQGKNEQMLPIKKNYD